MTTTTTPKNGQERKTLSSQLDRLDLILDALAEGLPQAVDLTVRETVGAAVQEAVKAAIIEVLSNPDLLARLRPASKPEPATVPSPPRGPGWLGRLAGATRAACQTAGQLVKKGASKVARVAGNVVQAARHQLAVTWQEGKKLAQAGWAFLRTALGVAWHMRKPLIIAVGAGTLIGVGCYCAGPVVASTVSGLAGFTGALVASTVHALQQMFLDLNLEGT
jgi:hypothetical protein